MCILSFVLVPNLFLFRTKRFKNRIFVLLLVHPTTLRIFQITNCRTLFQDMTFKLSITVLSDCSMKVIF